MKIIRKNILRILLIIVLILFFLYIFNNDFRSYLSVKGIDANFIVGFLTSITLILTLIQSSYDKKFNYNMRTVDSIESKGLYVIGKLLTIKQKSFILLGTLKTLKETMSIGGVFKDMNDISSKKDIDDGIEIIGAYVDTYFQENKDLWNELMDKLSIIGNNSVNILANYNENVDLIRKKVLFKNEYLDNIDSYILESESVDKNVEDLSLQIRDNIVDKINQTTIKMKDGFDFRV